MIEHFALKAGTPMGEDTERVTRVGEWFVNAIDDAYFNEASVVALAPSCVFCGQRPLITSTLAS